MESTPGFATENKYGFETYNRTGDGIWNETEVGIDVEPGLILRTRPGTFITRYCSAISRRVAHAACPPHRRALQVTLTLELMSCRTLEWGCGRNYRLYRQRIITISDVL
ncbi:hypothetical protein EVAR_82645_1 [Eumeta japonica]|uniref:Uncharacterized protein n=1 Tax=Eumeta variegata TaxID=151549 RepID=A0A4C1VAB6_EUMVA|nr:hypothetical protein EVAR_82645_1 [Eumeta japonica]